MLPIVEAHYATPDLDQGPIVTQREFNVLDDASEKEPNRLGQPLEAEALIETVRLHLEDQVGIDRGRTHLNGGADLGLPDAVQRAPPTTPVDEPLQPLSGHSARPTIEFGQGPYAAHGASPVVDLLNGQQWSTRLVSNTPSLSTRLRRSIAGRRGRPLATRLAPSVGRA